MVDAAERLQVLLSQETRIYRTSDYLSRIVTDVQMQAVLPVCSATSCDCDSSPESPSKKRKSLAEADPQYVDPPLPGNSDPSATTRINKHWREKICEWAYQVVDHFDLHREVVCIAMNHLDRYLAVYPHTVDKNLFQLLAMTCLYLSVKLNEYKHLLIPGSKSSMDTILQLSRGYFTLEQMEKMEHDVLQRLQWHVHPPTPQTFVKHFLFFLSIEEHEIHDLSQFMVELSVMDYFFVSYKPSEIAIAGVLIAIDRLVPGRRAQAMFPFDRTLIEIDTPQVQACRSRLLMIFAQANDQVTGTDAVPHAMATGRTTSPVSVMANPNDPTYQFPGSDCMDLEGMDDA